MHIKTDKDGFSTLLNLLQPQPLEQMAIKTFKKVDTNNAGILFAISDVGLKIAKAILSQKKKVSVSNTEACFIITWFASIENKQQDYYVQNIIRQVKGDLHKQLTNYQSKF